MTDKKYEYKKTENKDDSIVTLEVKILAELFNIEKENAFNSLAPNVRLKGFRAGKAPRHMVEASLGSDLIEETINRILPKITSEILVDENLEPITQVSYQISKVDPSGEIEYKASFTQFPTFKVTDLKKLKVVKDEVKITKEDVDKVVKNMFDDSMKEKALQDKGFKEPNEEWVTSLKMESIKDMKELEEQIEKTVKNQREMLAEEKYTLDLIKEIADESKVALPKTLLDKELELQENEYKKRVEDLGLKFDDFVRNQKINFDEMKENWRKEIVANFERDVVLMQIIKDNIILVTDEEVEREISQIKDPKMKGQFNNSKGRMNVKTVMLRQKAIAWIKEQVKK
ncbi:hypothetical protein KBD45_01750 [Candidatus Dojkabacteria bacterium]|nr:hypothetical protein [Candidatus Dojkabacteria bacterium]